MFRHSVLVSFLILGICGHAAAQAIDVSFGFPFRIRNLAGVQGLSGELEFWSVGGGGELVIKRTRSVEDLTIANPKVTLNALFFVNKETIIVVGSGGEIVLSKDRGRSWQKIPSGVTKDLNGVHCSGQSCWIVGVDGVLLRGSIDGGWSTRRIELGGTLKDVYFLDAKTGFVVGRGGSAMKTTDGGKTWRRLNIPPAPQRRGDGVPDFEFVSFKSDVEGCIAGWDIGVGIVSCTANGGDTWTTSELSLSPVGIIWGENGCVYLVDKFGRNYESTNNGETWRRRLVAGTTR